MGMQNLLSRRYAMRGLAASLAGAIVAPVATQAQDHDRRAAVQLHSQALLRLIRQEFPADYTAMHISIGANWGPCEHLRRSGSVSAQANRILWETEPRVKGGGLWVERDALLWRPGRPLESY